MRAVPTIWVHRCSVRQVSRQASMHVKGRIDGHEVREGTRPAQCCHQPGHGREPVAVPGACSLGSRGSKDVCHLAAHLLSGRLESTFSLLEAWEEA